MVHLEKKGTYVKQATICSEQVGLLSTNVKRFVDICDQDCSMHCIFTGVDSYLVNVFADVHGKSEKENVNTKDRVFSRFFLQFKCKL